MHKSSLCWGLTFTAGVERGGGGEVGGGHAETKLVLTTSGLICWELALTPAAARTPPNVRVLFLLGWRTATQAAFGSRIRKNPVWT